MVRAAKHRNFECFSITEHISQFKNPRKEIGFGSFHKSGRIFSDFDEYESEFANIGKKANKGLEVDFSPRYNRQVSDYVNERKWDILLLSVHELSGGKDIEDKEGPQDRESSEKKWMDYFKLQEEALQNDLVSFVTLTHPVRLATSTRIVPSNFDESLLELATIAKEEDKALELNGKDMARDYSFVERLAKACSEAHCRVSFGSDAHHPDEVGRGRENATDLIKRFSLSEAIFCQ